jgi:hypothetical protein
MKKWKPASICSDGISNRNLFFNGRLALVIQNLISRNPNINGIFMSQFENSKFQYLQFDLIEIATASISIIPVSEDVRPVTDGTDRL